ncbi:hypothetical protein NPIL_447211 [Nephila pilipes]|uniref:Uncharacterized protein n=1 Tax=Nephila pilipes TaxID=299642 RepID=A0A8X6QVV7_NEPPI|nr:hypothetical protein NPIL_447211 [Nephila pilipes]
MRNHLSVKLQIADSSAIVMSGAFSGEKNTYSSCEVEKVRGMSEYNILIRRPFKINDIECDSKGRCLQDGNLRERHKIAFLGNEKVEAEDKPEKQFENLATYMV